GADALSGTEQRTRGNRRGAIWVAGGRRGPGCQAVADIRGMLGAAIGAGRGLKGGPPAAYPRSRLGVCQSGQLGRTVNPLALAYTGSNPVAPTLNDDPAPRRGVLSFWIEGPRVR